MPTVTSAATTDSPGDDWLVMRSGAIQLESQGVGILDGILGGILDSVSDSENPPNTPDNPRPSGI